MSDSKYLTLHAAVYSVIAFESDVSLAVFCQTFFFIMHMVVNVVLWDYGCNLTSKDFKMKYILVPSYYHISINIY